MALDIIGAGLGRTGTLSLKMALEQLGFDPCYHMVELIEEPGRLPLWLQAARTGNTDWDAVLRGYRATVDYPGALFYQPLMERYPQAKVILTVRDPERWHESAMATIYPGGRSEAFKSLPDEWQERMAFINELIWEGQFGGRFSDREHAVAEFVRHRAEVEAAVPAERLLVFEVSQGWEPLCEFLGVPVPDEPFPRSNDRASFQARMRERLEQYK